VDPASHQRREATIGELTQFLRAGDLLVVNDAATLPASLSGQTASGEHLEARLAGGDEREWLAVLFGPGSWREKTEERAAPPRVGRGERLLFGPGLTATVVRTSALSPRLVWLAFEGPAFWESLYLYGKPIQYSYLETDVSLSDVQTPYAGRPWAFEPPSAGRPLQFSVFAALQKAGVAVAPLTHAAGISSTGDPALDAHLPLPERFKIPERTSAAVERTHRGGGRVVAVGTTVVRALEGARILTKGPLRGIAGVTALRLTEGFPLRIVDGLLTGIHEPGTSHFELLTAFEEREALAAAFTHAEARGYLGHEFGDSMLILKGTVGARTPRSLAAATWATPHDYDSGVPPHVPETGSRLTTRSISRAPTRHRRSEGKTAA
jgi:S-adenosylmethionine:tRNA ribosyltransferase-isomerase